MSFLTSLEGVVMNNEDMKSIFDQINNLKKTCYRIQRNKC